jgi:Undecaprenyl-phosphate galactose phosphotransferase WbaP
MNAALELCRPRASARPRLLGRARPVWTGGALGAADLAALALSALAAAGLWRAVNPTLPVGAYAELWPVLLLFVAAYAALGLYPGVGLSPVGELRRIVIGTTIVDLVLASAIFLTREEARTSRGVFILAWLLSATLVPLGRAAARHLFARRPWWGVPVIVFGAGKTAQLVVESLAASPGLGLKPVACLDDDGGKRGELAGVGVVGNLALAPELARSFGVRHALVAMPGLPARQLLAVLERWASVFPHVIIIPDLFGMASLWVTPRDLGGVLGLELRQNLLLPANRFVKRAVDVVFGALFALIALPLVAAAAAWIRLTDRGGAFYEQEREGEGGRLIRIRKLRTMYGQADRLLREHLSRDPDAREEWRRHFKLRHDPRILPRVGAFLRRTSLDELPQLWSVLKGEMSLVGPRPFPFYHLEQFGADFRRLRAKVRPGLTGLWQVSARSDGDLAVQQKLDSYYIRNWSLWLDLYILARTVKAVLARDGAY